jgi:hypothetical protein
MKYRLSVFISLLLSIVFIMSVQLAGAQDASIEITGIVEAVGDGTITVNGLPVDLSSVDANTASQIVTNSSVRIVGNLQNGVVIAITIEILNQPTPTPQPSGGLILNGFNVSYGGRVYDSANNRTTFTYVVTGTGTPPDLSHFDVQIPVCNPALEVVAYSPTDAVSFGTDPTTGVNGIKWDLPLQVNATRTYSITFDGVVPEGSVTVAVKGGSGFQAGSLPGAGCSIASVNIEKLVSVDGGATWQDADGEPGPQVALNTPITFRFVVTNTGQTTLTNLLLTDNTFDVSACAIPASLAPGALFECAIGPINAEAGQHTNIATIVAVSQTGDDDDGGSTIEVRDTDSANYFGGERPSIKVEKSVSKDGSNWGDDDESEFEIGDDVFFRFVVTNDGSVPVSNITLNDSSYSTASCAIPAVLDAGASFECVIGPFDAVEGRHTNTVTVRARYNEFEIIDSDTASYFGGDDDDTGGLLVTIVIEGPVQNININIITIYDIDIELNADDPLLTVIQIGDNVRVEGNMTNRGDTIIIIAVTVVVVDVDIVISDDHTVVWRDNGNCGNPPPPWAPAHGWRRRCENRGGTVIIIPGGSDIPSNCKLTGFGNGNIRCKGGSGRGSGRGS